MNSNVLASQNHRDDQRRREYVVMSSLSALRWIGNLAETSSIEQKEG